MNGYYEIRLESIGGLGANLCGKMLGELAVKYLNMNSAGFSSYGSEKTGTPVRGHIRYCEKKREIRVHSPVIHPNLLVIFHQALMKEQKVWEGCNEDTEVIVALDGGWKMEQIPIKVKSCYVIPAQQIAMETHSGINVVMLGAIVKVMNFGSLQDAKEICKDMLGGKYPENLQGNLEGIERGFQEIEKKKETGIYSERSKKADESERDTAWGYDTAPIGGINPIAGSTAAVDVSPSRQGYIPVFIKERCINCGLCDSTCPDMVFQFAKGEYKGREMMVNRGLDYYHCKGCLRCVEICPVNALVCGVEAEHQEKSYFLPNQALIRKPDYYLKAGPDGYITSESFLTEKRMEKGEV